MASKHTITRGISQDSDREKTDAMFTAFTQLWLYTSSWDMSDAMEEGLFPAICFSLACVLYSANK